MTTKKPRVGVYVSEEEYQALQDLAQKQRRSVSSLINLCISEYLEGTNKNDLAQFLKALVEGKEPPSDTTCIALAEYLNLDREILISLRDRMFSTNT